MRYLTSLTNSCLVDTNQVILNEVVNTINCRKYIQHLPYSRYSNKVFTIVLYMDFQGWWRETSRIVSMLVSRYKGSLVMSNRSSINSMVWLGGSHSQARTREIVECHVIP